MAEVKMKKIKPKTFSERNNEMSFDGKNLPSGHINFEDNNDLKNCVIGSTIIIKQKVKVTKITEHGVSYDIQEMGTVKLRTPRKNNK